MAHQRPGSDPAGDPTGIFREYGLDINQYGGTGEILNMTRGGNPEDIRRLAAQIAASDPSHALQQVEEAFKRRQEERNRRKVKEYREIANKYEEGISNLIKKLP